MMSVNTGSLLSVSALIFLLGGYFPATAVFFLAPVLILFLFLFIFASTHVVCYIKELLLNDQRPPIAGFMLQLIFHFDRLYDYQASLSRKFGGTYRLITPSTSHLYVVDPANVEYMLKTNFSNYDKGELNSDIMRDLFGNGIFAVDGEKWRHQRKLASHEFSTKNLRDYSSSAFRSNAAKLVPKVSAAATATEIIDMQDLLMRSTLDSIFKVGFGVELNSLCGSDDLGNRFSKAFDDSNALVFGRYVDPFWKVKRFFNIGSEATLKQKISVIDDFAYTLIKHKREQMRNGMVDGAKEDILSRFLLEGEKDPDTITDKYLRDITLNFIIAGKDTTANTLTWFFYMICKHPMVQESIVQEVRDATIEAGKGISPDEFSTLLTEEALNKMQYLHAALTETLRLFPAVPGDGKVAAKDDTLADGFKVKKGDAVTYLAYSMGRTKRIWGDDAEEFNPQRWLKDGVFKPESSFKFAVFHAGPRICLGKEFAYRQMKICAAMLLYFFRFKLADENKEAAYRTMFTLHMDQGLQLYPIPRQ